MIDTLASSAIWLRAEKTWFKNPIQIECGDEVTFLDLHPNLEYLRKVLGRELAILRGDIREPPALIEAMQSTKAEVVFHSGGLQGNRTPYFGFKVNLIGTLNVAESVCLTGVRRLITPAAKVFTICATRQCRFTKTRRATAPGGHVRHVASRIGG